jgi:hypothetical protein
VGTNRIDVGFLIETFRGDRPLVRGDIDGVEENVLQIDVAVRAQNPDRIFDIAGVNRIAALKEVVKFTEQLAGERLLRMTAGDFKRTAVYPNPDSERLLDGTDVAVLLPEQFREEAMVVEVKFERILVG